MKKIILTLLLVALAISTHCDCGTVGAACCSGTGGCTQCPDPSFDVNSQVCVQQPGTIQPPECLVPEVECPETCPPPVNPPTICTPEIEVDSRDVPDVVCPPTIEPPSVEVPPPELCVIKPPPPPPLPPCIEDPYVPEPPSIPEPEPPKICDDTLPRKFKLSFQYACRKWTSFLSCQANILWNNVIIATIIPSDYNVHTYSIWVEVVGGENKLQIEGAGIKDRKGLTIDNVRLVRYGTNTNIVVNGGFQAPSVGYSWGIFNNIPGWEGVGIELGWGKIYNHGWSSQVCELDGRKNYQITQRWSFDSQYKLVKQIPCDTNNFIGKFLTFKLEFDYAARKNGVASPSTSSANILWNNVVIGTLTPNNYAVHHAVFYVQLKAGQNFLQFDGSGPSDKHGLNIDNVKLTSKYNNYYNLIHNAGFENPNLGAGNWVYTWGGIPHWKAQRSEHGDCKNVYNANWPAASKQCIELDSHQNQRYTHVVLVSQINFSQYLINKATLEGDASVQNEIDCSLNEAQSYIGSAVAKIAYDIYCDIHMTVQ